MDTKTLTYKAIIFSCIKVKTHPNLHIWPQREAFHATPIQSYVSIFLKTHPLKLPKLFLALA